MTGFAEQFDADIKSITVDRGATYAHPFKDFRRVAAIKAVLSECPDPVLRHALEMIAVKMARLVHSPEHYDSWLDIAGYVRCALMVLDERKKQA
jgi:hypothetical protein